MWDLPRPGLEPVSPALAGRFSTTAPPGKPPFFKIYLINLFIYFWLCWVFVSVRGLSLVAASGGHSSSRWAGLSLSQPLLLREHRLQMCRLSSCGSRDQLLRSMWDLPRPGLEPVSPALVGIFSTTAPPGKPQPLLCSAPLSTLSPVLTNWQVPQRNDSSSPRGHILPFCLSGMGTGSNSLHGTQISSVT